jgi:hypothetical protein
MFKGDKSSVSVNPRLGFFDDFFCKHGNDYDY